MSYAYLVVGLEIVDRQRRKTKLNTNLKENTNIFSVFSSVFKKEEVVSFVRAISNICLIVTSAILFF